MGCGHSTLSCCKPPKKRRREPGQPPRPEPQELGPLNGDTATTAQLCASEEAEQHQKDITRIFQQHEEDKKKWIQQVEKERELELREKLDEQRRVLEGEHEAALKDLQASYEQEKEALTRSFQEAKTALQETIDGLTSQLEVFQAKMKRVEESILSRDYKKHIQDYGSPSQFWEQELESLHFVIEMKNERIHELDKRLILMETVKEKNLMLEEKITTLQQENEDLHVRGRSSRTTCFLPARPWRRSHSTGDSCSRRRRSCCTGRLGLMPPPPSPWPQSPPPRSPSWPHRLRAWAAMTSVVTAPSPGLSREDSKSLSFFSQEAMRAGVRWEPGCVPLSPGGLGHVESPRGLWRPQGVLSLELAQEMQQEESFPPCPSLCSNQGVLRLFPGGACAASAI
ncbi:coiled-coil domain-containing protein 69 isoform X2 [Rhinolophus ferrumequinum]|uniref:coiled-coil domain-containing protein 69 isoform X2 n=1 Tax=Rhinolophus ferrumequinum TaxID=59479 RepID=UPI00140F70DE|nr:coiled-coil domain-containing protein 69 isoform X2 [Rhinolophus ferrumequinum]